MFRKPALAKASATIPTGRGWVAEAKYDGWRCIAEVLEDRVVLRTRTGNIITQVPYIENALKALPAGTIIDGEIVDLTTGTESTFNRVVSVLKRNDEQLVCSANLPLTFVAFDLIEADNEDLAMLPLSSRRKLLETLFTHESLAENRYLGVKLLALAEQFPSSEDAFDTCIELGFEGIVAKKLDEPYAFGDRRWIKVKPDAEVEVVCTGVYDAAAGSKYDGRCVGGLTFRYTREDGTTLDGQCAGKMNDKLRADLYENTHKYIGMVMEIGHWGETDNGSLRHPSFRRFREDKSEPNPTPAPAHVSTAPQKSVRGDDLFKAPKTAKRGRNYRQMKPDKLFRTRSELEIAIRDGVSNEASTKAGDLSADLATCDELLLERGL